MIKMKDDQNRRRPKWKTTIMEDNQNERPWRWMLTYLKLFEIFIVPSRVWPSSVPACLSCCQINSVVVRLSQLLSYYLNCCQIISSVVRLSHLLSYYLSCCKIISAVVRLSQHSLSSFAVFHSMLCT